MSKAPYAAAADALLAHTGVEVRTWHHRPGKGTAHHDGTITVPRPNGPVGFGTLAHEVGHVVLGHVDRYPSAHGPAKPRWMEETEAWDYSLRCMFRYELQGWRRVHGDAARCLAYAYGKACRRGNPSLPQRIAWRYPGWWADALASNKGGHLAPFVNLTCTGQ